MKLRCPFKVNLFSRENTEFILFRHFKKDVLEDLSLHTKNFFPRTTLCTFKSMLNVQDWKPK